MTEQNNPDRGMRFLVIAAALAIIIWGINQAQLVLELLLVSVFLLLSSPRSSADLYKINWDSAHLLAEGGGSRYEQSPTEYRERQTGLSSTV